VFEGDKHTHNPVRLSFDKSDTSEKNSLLGNGGESVETLFTFSAPNNRIVSLIYYRT
jgi:hypothetical protein